MLISADKNKALIPHIIITEIASIVTSFMSAPQTQIDFNFQLLFSQNFRSKIFIHILGFPLLLDVIVKGCHIDKKFQPGLSIHLASRDKTNRSRVRVYGNSSIATDH